MSLTLIAIFGLIGMQLVIGLAIRHGIKSESDYLVAGRKLGPVISFFTIFATWFGAESCISGAASGYREGITLLSPEPFGYGLALIVMGLFFARLLWARKLTTLADLFAQQFGSRVEKLAAFVMAPTSMLWASAQILAFSQVIAATSQMSVTTSIILSGFIVIFYTTVGGLLADAVTDLLQGAILIGCLIILFIAFWLQGDHQPAELFHTALSSLETSSHSTDIFSIMETWAIPICGSLVAQELISRICAVRHGGIAQKTSVAAGAFYILMGLIPLFMGVMGRDLYPALQESDQILPMMAKNHLPEFFYVLFAAALVSIIMSTVDSALLASGSLISHNILMPLFGIKDERKKLLLARVCVVVLGVAACLLAFTGDNVYDLVEEASAFGSAGVFILFISSIWAKRKGREIAGIATLVLGLVSWIVGAHVLELQHPYLTSLMFAGVGFVFFTFAPQVYERFFKYSQQRIL